MNHVEHALVLVIIAHHVLQDTVLMAIKHISQVLDILLNAPNANLDAQSAQVLQIVLNA